MKRFVLIMAGFMVSTTRRIGLALLGIIFGSAFGGVVGLLSGLTYVGIAGSSGFEGYSGFVVAFWIIGGVTIGMMVGLVFAYRAVRKHHY